ncbi:hypothetical protein CDD81_4140 [Ophiocordyceps australis]|uniref:Zn(2)-C6 fungal-type domain-containing protein n=1 Tax=Ophiocordyceps australis TaxID=1399860 RepID=A0A2C5XAI7_9HYPO|nr:hypothetical protein CDD81_4140 [Ophiocordyceps australis]
MSHGPSFTDALASAYDSDESWHLVDSTTSSATGSVLLVRSPASASLCGYGVVRHASSPRGLGEASKVSAAPQQLGQVDEARRGLAQGGGQELVPHECLFAGEWAQREQAASTPFMMTIESGPFCADTLPSKPHNASPAPSCQELQLPPDALGISGTRSDSGSKSPRAGVRKARRGRANSARHSSQSSASSHDPFVIMTPQSMSAPQSRPNALECFEAMRVSQRGRKGPLASKIKESALQVRRRGACFCCHSRKVKCDMERPCQRCKKLMQQVPQVVCWQFQDFNVALFPDFIRAHFRTHEMARFLRDSIQEFRVGGVNKPCRVELFSGSRLSATLQIEASFFTAKSCDALQHWHLNAERGRLQIESNGSTPIGLDFESGAHRHGLRKKVEAYVDAIVDDARFVEQVTESVRSTQLPAKVLAVVHKYAQQSGSVMVKRALSIYAMHYIMTRHLCITQRCVTTLLSSGLVPQNTQWVTSRVLTRQIKSLVDELLIDTMQQLFDLFSRSLKPKCRREWAPCTAAFLVLCLFMEAVETTAESFVASQLQVDARNHSSPVYGPDFALRVCRELENMPFKQFAYQFHNTYQTHSKDVNTTSFNPLFDNHGLDNHHLEGPDLEMIQGLRELLRGEYWQDLQFLADDDIVLNKPDSFPIDPSYIYTGRLVSKFLLSFANDKIIFEGRL